MEGRKDIFGEFYEKFWPTFWVSRFDLLKNLPTFRVIRLYLVNNLPFWGVSQQYFYSLFWYRSNWILRCIIRIKRNQDNFKVERFIGTSVKLVQSENLFWHFVRKCTLQYLIRPLSELLWIRILWSLVIEVITAIYFCFCFLLSNQ